MILLKANDKLKAVFQKIIKTMGENVEWTDIFLINNNDLILLGRVRSLFFHFDNKRADSNMIDITVNEESIEQITDNEMLENSLNMTLYTFGKWGVIKGLRVEKDYDQLNKLLQYIFQDIHAEASLTKDYLRFYKDGVQVTYEEIIQFILSSKKPAEDQIEETLEEDITEQEEESDYSLGLWHKIAWKSTKLSFVKEEMTEEDKAKSRLGNDFYMVNYRCPSCSEKLYMVVYPMGEEFRIETDEGGVYLARAYTCSSCKSFYTPKPQKLLSEGEVYWLTFEDDAIAYEDYQELLGKQGQKTSNCNFNEYEEDYIDKNKEDSASLEEMSGDFESMSEDEIEEIKDKMDSGFYSEETISNYKERLEQELSNRKESQENEKRKEEHPNSEQEDDGIADKDNGMANQDKKTFLSEGKDEKRINEENNKENNKDRKLYDTDKPGLFYERKRDSNWDEVNQQKKTQHSGTKNEEIKNNESQNASKFPTINLRELVTSLFNGESPIFNQAIQDLSKEQLRELKLMIQSEQGIEDSDKKTSIDMIDRYLYKDKEKEVLERVVSCKGKSYEHILSVINDIKDEEISEGVKASILSSLKKLLDKTGKKELERLVSQIPVNVSKKQYEQFKDKIEAYEEIDKRLSEKILDEKRDNAEKQEIAAFMKRANPRNRNTYLDTYKKLKEQSFEERNVEPVLEKILNKVYDMDKAAIERICKEPADLTFEQGLKAYDEILLGEYLPELKEDMLSQIDKRLTKLKVDECEQLVSKLVKEISSLIKEDSRFYFYQVRKMMRENREDANSIIIHNALKSYAEEKGKYEYPILICDTSYARNGESGFLLTPNHIFYRSLLDSGVIDVMDIEEVYARNSLISKGIYVNYNTGKVKISNSLQSTQLQTIAKVLHDFVSYLKEKPESRNISYMAKEVHKVKCCYRCGYVYSEGSVCPKCGSKMNE
jgi:hypothetical protein